MYLVEIAKTPSILLILCCALLAGSCAHDKAGERDNMVLNEDIPINGNGRHLREMRNVECSHWISMIASVERRLNEQLRYQSINEDGLFAIKVRMTELVNMAFTHYSEFPPDLDFDLRNLINRIDRAIVSYHEPQMVSTVEIPIRQGRRPSIVLRPFQFRWPVTNVDITSPYGMRKDPLNGSIKFHDGIDLGDNMGVLVYAAERGRVIFSGYKGAAGRLVVIQHEKGYKTYYAHLNRLLTVRGLTVERGQPIGQIGRSGRSTGPHLHFKISYFGKSLDPDKYVGAILE